MGSNTTQRKAQAVLLRARVADYREWRLIADCGSCGPRALQVGSLDPSATFMQILQRLRCRACGGRAAAVSLANDMPGWQNRVVRIWGVGSFG